jgi:Holliday junction resolvasome RuvABC endonuclease subunit
VTNPLAQAPAGVLAADPGLAHFGWGCVSRFGAKLDLVDSGHIETAPQGDRHDAAAKAADLRRRLRAIWHGFAVACRTYRPRLVALESQDQASIGARVRGLEAAARGEKGGGFNSNNDHVMKVVGVVYAVAFSFGIEVFEYSPQQAKNGVLGAGHARATKAQVMAAIRVYFPGIERDGHRLDEHSADAIAGAIYCERVTYLSARAARRRTG